jgi:putative Mg2+ transporter-C (MgtC) family protein
LFVSTAMPTAVSWHDIALRLGLTVLAAGAIGFNRDERGHSAGLRTNLLVGLAACVAMLQANLLINSVGKPADSFVVMDIMRLPLGILSGIGFIGAGAIIKRGEMIVGVTTAATLWFVTVMGLCFGGGQNGLGLAAFGLGFVVLTGLKKIENEMAREQSGMLNVTVSAQGPSREQIESLLKNSGLRLANPSLTYETPPDGGKTFGWKVRWKSKPDDSRLPAVIQDLEKQQEVRRLELTR